MDREDLNPDEVACLLGALDSDSGPLEFTLDASQSSFRQRYRRLGDGFAAALSALVNSEAQVELSEIESITYGEFVLRAACPTSFHLADIEPNMGSIILETPPRFLGLLFDHMLGGGRAVSNNERQPETDIEWRLVTKVVQRCLEQFESVWQDLLGIRVTYERRESSRLALRLLTADQSVMQLHYQVCLAGDVAKMHVIVPEDWPVRLVRGAVDVLRSGKSTSVSPTDGQNLRELIAVLAETQIASSKLANLAVGDMIPTEKDVGEPLTVLVDGTPKFRANLGKLGEKKAVQIVETLLGRNEPDGD